MNLPVVSRMTDARVEKSSMGGFRRKLGARRSPERVQRSFRASSTPWSSLHERLAPAHPALHFARSISVKLALSHSPARHHLKLSLKEVLYGQL